MNGGPAAPASLTLDDLRALQQIRKDIWVHAAQGFFGGGSAAYLMHRAGKMAHNRQWIKSSLSTNAAFAGVMIGASIGSFLMATTTGKNSVHTLHPVFARNARPMAVPDDNEDKTKVSYKDAQFRAQETLDMRDFKNKSLSLTRQRTQMLETLSAENDRDDRDDLVRNRVMRRASLTSNLKTGHGLNDSHGGQWVQRQQQQDTTFREE